MRIPILASLLLTFGCKEGEEGIAVPAVGTEFALFGTAAEGRAIQASSVRVARTAEIEGLTPEQIAGGKIDMVFAGLDPADFPIDLSPADLVFVRAGDERARPLPAVHAPHVFEEPAPFDHPSELVPVDQESVPKEFLADRQERLERMLQGFEIENPCREPLAEISVFTPRIPANAVLSMRTLSSGETFIGFSATSTAIMGVLGPSDVEPEIIGITTSTAIPIEEGETADISDLGDTEVVAGGRNMPGEIVLNTQGGFGAFGGVAFWSPARGRYQDDTPPLVDALPRFLFGVRHVTLDGSSLVCAYGGIQGSDRGAGIWCRPASGGAWNLRGRFTRKFGVTRLADAGGLPLAFDLAGTVYEHAGDDDWNPIFTSSLNAGCDPLCANFAAVAVGSMSDLFGVMAGSKAQILFILPGGGSVQAVAPEQVTGALFADERADAEMPATFRAVHLSPDGALWLGTETPDLLRVSPDRSKVDRICLPEELAGNAISEIHAQESGRLIIGMAPAIFAFTDWRL